MRLIDADERKQQLENPYTEYPIMIQIRKVLKDFIDDAPTVDPVKHGRWEHRMLTSYPAKAICVCNLCGQVVDIEYFYCPHCGAKMELF